MWSGMFRVLGFVAMFAAAQAWAAEVTVYKSPTCGCCQKWVEHLEENGFEVKTYDVRDVVSYKARMGVPPALGSCHTALVDGYVIEGHVPADDIKRMLTQRPAIAGLAVPGMPVGSPGMEQGGRRDRYDVLSFTEDGTTEVFATHQ